MERDHWTNVPVDGTSTSRMNMKMTVIPPIKTKGSLNPPTWRRQREVFMYIYMRV